jgi:hypothetical protein
MKKELPDHIAVLRLMLSEVNTEWLALAREGGSAAKPLRMAELRILRLALITRIFSIEQRDANHVEREAV